MGKSEWGFMIKNKNDLKHVIDVVKLHNDWNNTNEVGEVLYFFCIFRYKSKMYCCVGNEGGRNYTIPFIATHFKGKEQIFEPFEKPSWWFLFDKQEMIWEAEKDSEIPDPDIIF